MSNLYLAKSEKDRNQVGDVIVNLDKVERIRARYNNTDKDYLLKLETSEGSAVMCFSTEELLRDELKVIVKKMGANTDIADLYHIQIPEENSKKQDILAKLRELKTVLEK